MPRPWNPSSHRHLPTQSSPPFQNPSVSATRPANHACHPTTQHLKDGAPFSSPATPQTRNHGPAQRVPTIPNASPQAGRDALCRVPGILRPSPTCPLTDRIEYDTQTVLEGLVNSVAINWVWLPPWSLEMITDDGREQLRAIGYNV